MRVLVGLGQDRSRGDVHRLAVVLEHLLAPHARDHPRRLLELRRDLLHLRLEGTGLLGRATLADPEVDATAAQDVEHRDALGDLDRMVHAEGQADDAVPDADPLGAPGHVGEEGLRGAHVGVPLQTMVLHGPDAVEAHLLGEHGLLDALVHHLVLFLAARVGHLGFEDHRELHRSLLGSRLSARNRAAAAARSWSGKSWKWTQLKEREETTLATTSVSVSIGTSSRTRPRAIDSSR